MSSVEVSVVIPVYNEEDGLQALFDRLYPALDGLGASYEIVFINDGSKDRSAALLSAQFRLRPDVKREPFIGRLGVKAVLPLETELGVAAGFGGGGAG